MKDPRTRETRRPRSGLSCGGSSLTLRTALCCSACGRAAELASFASLSALKQLRRVRGTKRAARAARNPALLAATNSPSGGRRVSRRHDHGMPFLRPNLLLLASSLQHTLFVEAERALVRVV